MGFDNREKLGLAKSQHIQQLARSLAQTPCIHFTVEECENMLKTFRKVTNGTNRLDRQRFRAFIHAAFFITDHIMLDLLFRAYDRNCDGSCDEAEFITGLSVMIRGTLEEQIDFCYRVYDMNGDGSLAREELYHCVRGCIYPGYGIEADEIDDAERDIVEILMKKLDYDRDGLITFDDFRNAVNRDPLLLSAIGPCMPNVSSIATFMALYVEDCRGYSGAFMDRRSRQLAKQGSHGGLPNSSSRDIRRHRGSSLTLTQSQLPYEYSKLGPLTAY